MHTQHVTQLYAYDTCAPAPRSKVGLVPTALGGTNLYRDWQLDGELYNYMMEQTKAALAAAPGSTLRGMLWVHLDTGRERRECKSWWVPLPDVLPGRCCYCWSVVLCQAVCGYM